MQTQADFKMCMHILSDWLPIMHDVSGEVITIWFSVRALSLFDNNTAVWAEQGDYLSCFTNEKYESQAIYLTFMRSQEYFVTQFPFVFTRRMPIYSVVTGKNIKKKNKGVWYMPIWANSYPQFQVPEFQILLVNCRWDIMNGILQESTFIHFTFVTFCPV